MVETRKENWLKLCKWVNYANEAIMQMRRIEMGTGGDAEGIGSAEPKEIESETIDQVDLITVESMMTNQWQRCDVIGVRGHWTLDQSVANQRRRKFLSARLHLSLCRLVPARSFGGYFGIFRDFWDFFGDVF